MADIYIILKALADETRFQIINLLLTHDLCVGALAHRLNISKAATSQHLQILRKAGLIKGEKRGYWTHYVVDRDRLKELGIRLTKISELRPQPEDQCLRALPMAQRIQKARRINKMCMDCCQRPEKLKGKPIECSPEQVKECHGDVKDHPCLESKDQKK